MKHILIMLCIVYSANAQNDSLFFSTVGCKTVTFTNTASTFTTITKTSHISKPFTESIPLSFQLQPEESATFEICYNPTITGKNKDTLSFTSSTRTPLSIALLFDVSGSMKECYTSDSITFIEAAKQAGQKFINGLFTQDETAVYSFESSENFSQLQEYTTNKELLNKSIPDYADGKATCIYDALMKTIKELSIQGSRKVLIILTDGRDTGEIKSCGNDVPNEIITAANASGIIIYCIKLGKYEDPILTNIANQTGGEFFTAQSSNNLITRYKEIANSLSKNVEVKIFLTGEHILKDVEKNSQTALPPKPKEIPKQECNNSMMIVVGVLAAILSITAIYIASQAAASNNSESGPCP